MDTSVDWVQDIISTNVQTHARSAIAQVSGPIGKDGFDD